MRRVYADKVIDGKCPVCKIKCIKYDSARHGHNYFCYRCNREFDLNTGEFRPNWGWIKFDYAKRF